LPPRIDGRQPDELRPVRIVPGYLDYAEGSVLVEQGQTRVLCAASLEERVPGWLMGRKRGWVTAEYAMLPRSTLTRTPRERAQGRDQGRSLEIQRLVGRSLRAVTDLVALGERSIMVDCDVIQADGGTRTAAITGAYVALYMALERLQRQGAFSRMPLREPVAAVSVGIVGGDLLLDLCYEEDSRAEADFNIVMTASGDLVEVQGAAEGGTYTRKQLLDVLDLAEKGLRDLFEAQRGALGQSS
jgi:ribonuclease PH